MNNGKNRKNSKARKDKGEGIRKQIITMLEDICFGPYEFEVASIWRDSLFINSILTNSETWYNLSKTEVDQLEQIDEHLLRSILETGRATPKVMLYLEMGSLPIRFILMKRRIIYLHYILHQDKDSLLYKVFKAQESNPVKGDWCLSVKEDIKYLQLDLSFDEISVMSETTLKNVLNKKAEKKALEYLNKEKKSKTKHIIHHQLNIQPYLKAGKMNNMQRKFLFQLRARMLDLKVNFQGSHSNLQCELCGKHEDNQESLLTCEKLMDSSGLVGDLPVYNDLFEQDVEKQFQISAILKKKFDMRNKLLNEMKKKS